MKKLKNNKYLEVRTRQRDVMMNPRTAWLCPLCWLTGYLVLFVMFINGRTIEDIEDVDCYIL